MNKTIFTHNFKISLRLSATQLVLLILVSAFFCTNVIAETTSKPSMLLVAENYSLAQNGSTMVKWRSQDTTQCRGDGNWASSSRTYGNQRVGPLSRTTTYRVTCSGPGGSVSKSITIAVDNQQPEPELEPEPELTGPKPSMLLVAENYSLAQNGSTMVKWRSQDTTQCRGDGNWASSSRTYGNQRVGPLSRTTTYRVTCSGPGGSVSKSITIAVDNQQPELKPELKPEDVPTTTGFVELNWITPETNEDGTPLFDLTGYKIYYGVSQSNLKNVIDIDAGLTSYVIEDLPPGTHYFAISAVDLSSNESSRSNIAAKVIN